MNVEIELKKLLENNGYISKKTGSSAESVGNLGCR